MPRPNGIKGRIKGGRATGTRPGTGAQLIVGSGVGGEHVQRVTVCWASDERPIAVEFDTRRLSPERIAEVWALLERALADDPGALRLI